MLSSPPPILIADRFPVLLDSLMDLLASLTDEEWQRPVHGAWSVKDLAQHLLGDELNILSGQRDGYREKSGHIDSWDDLVTFINDRNDIWVRATRRLSPRIIMDLLREAGVQANAFFVSLDPFAIGGPVNWAGPDPAPFWLDIAREFTERWHHQQHIRAAVGKPGGTEPYVLAPVLAAFVRALPVTYQHVVAPDQTCVTLTISGEAGGAWTVMREGERWQLYAGKPEKSAAEITLPEDVAWRLFTCGFSKEAARNVAVLSGDRYLAERALETVSIIA